MGMVIILLVLGLVLLVVGAELLVKGASRVAAAFRISPLVIGLTVVAYGTSAPELAVSTMAGLAGQADLALGNVVGSNIFNVLFILGVSSLIVPLAVSQRLVFLDVPLMIGISVLVLLMGLDGHIGRIDGLVLVAGIIAYTTFVIRQSRREELAVQQEYEKEFGEVADRRPVAYAMDALLVLGGLALLVLGSRWLVQGAVAIAAHFGVSEMIIGLTIVAAGTSLPEVATSIVASIRGERDIAVGNVVGSNIFNLLGVLGLAGVVSPAGVAVAASALHFDIPVMLAVAVACLPIFFTGHTISRWEGVLFLAYYLAYTSFLILGVTGNPGLPVFRMAMLGFAIPLTAVTLLVVSVRALRTGRNGAHA